MIPIKLFLYWITAPRKRGGLELCSFSGGRRGNSNCLSFYEDLTAPQEGLPKKSFICIYYLFCNVEDKKLLNWSYLQSTLP